MELICEIMLMSEGFQNAQVLGIKFITLYRLCKELLSKQVQTSMNTKNVVGLNPSLGQKWTDPILWVN